MESRPSTHKGPSAWETVKDIFPFGLAPFIILVLTVLSGLFLLTVTVVYPPEAAHTDLSMWTFARQHYVAYEKARPAFERKYNVTLDLQSVHGDAVTRRLRAAYWANLDLPDAVEVEISRAGSFFRGPADDILFTDITEFLTRPDPADPQKRPLMDRIVKTRLSPYTHRGKIYGLPHDVHPVMLAYRADLFEQFGIDANELQTWDDFVRVGRRITNHRDRYMINLAKGSNWAVEILLFQRAEPNAPAGYFDADGRLIMDNDKAVELLTWYVPLVKGPGRIAADPGMFGQAFAKATQDGYTLCSFCPDWKSWGFQNDMPQLAGKMKLMPLPAVRKGGRRTSTWGGTMLGITRKCRDRELAWKLARHMYMDPDDLGDRFGELNILPPFKDSWSHPAFHEKRPYWCNQQLGTEYIKLAEQTPPQFTSPFIQLAKSKMGEVVASCVAAYDPDDPGDLKTLVRERLRRAADEIRKQMKRNPF